MSFGGLLALIVFLVMGLSFLLPMPDWTIRAGIMLLALAILGVGYPIRWGTPA